MIFGGEPLLYIKELKAIRNFFHGSIAITTNGIGLTEEIQDWLVNNNIRPTISIDGAPRTNALHRPISPNYLNIKQYIEKCKQRGIKTICQSTVTPFTVSELYNSYLFISMLGFDSWWYEPEYLSFRTHSKKVFNSYKTELKKIFEIKDLSPMKIRPLEIEENSEAPNIYINAKGEIHLAEKYILLKTAETADLFNLGTIYSPRENFLQYIDDMGIGIFCHHILPQQKTKYCEACKFSRVCLDPESQPLAEHQHSCNCIFLKTLSEVMDEYET